MRRGRFRANRPDEKPRVTLALLSRVFNYAKPYRWQLIGMLATILLGSGLSLLTPLIFRNMIDDVLPAKNLTRLVWLTLALLAIPVLSGGIRISQRRLDSVIGEGVIFDLRSQLFGHLQRMSLRFFTNTKTGELMSRLNNDVIGAQGAISNTIVDMITNSVQVLALLIVMLSLEWRLTLISALILPFFIITAQRLEVILRDIARQSMSLNAKMNAHMNETLNIGGMLLVKLFGRANEETNRFSERAARVREIGIHRAVIGSSFFVVFSLVTAVGTALVYGIGGYFVIADVFTVGTIVAFGSYLAQFYSALQDLASAPVDFSTSMVSFERVFEILDLPRDIAEKENAIVLKDVRGELQFDNVSFNYATDQSALLKEVKRYGQHEDVSAVFSEGASSQPALTENSAAADSAEAESTSQARATALEKISFIAHPGQLVALVGPSGAGKTTTTYLVPRLYDPSDGVIRIDGINLKDATLESLAEVIGMVTQETYLFHDSIRLNLTYARPNATQAEIEVATQAANIHNFIAALPNGYDTIVGERGYRLSGGERQRLALARVILKNPRILVLDEATSSLDSESEALIQEALKHVMAGRTSIVIAHRLSTILAADLILVMDRGRIVERGTHQELIERNGLYHHLYKTQFHS